MSFLVASLSFVDNLGFEALDSSIKVLVKTIENITKAVLEWRRLNAVTYNISKTEAVLFLEIILATVKQTTSRSKNKSWR